MATQADERTANPVAVIRQNLTAMEPEFKAALPPHIPVKKFKRVALTAIQNTPALVNADRRSLFGAFVRLAQDGLLPDGREAAIVMFGNKAQAMPMIAGILKKIRQSGEVAKISAQVVYSNDKFVVKYGFDEDVEHIPPALNEPRGEPIGAYATAVLKDGSQLLEVMSLEQIEQVRKVSRASGNGPWVSWFGEMARKTVMRRLSKRLPMSTDLEDEIFSRDETMRTNLQPVGHQIEAEPTRPVTRLDALEHQIGGESSLAERDIGKYDDTLGREVMKEDVAPAVQEEIEEQAEELEAEIEQPQAQTDAFGLEPVADAPHPGTAKADAIIAEINDAATNAEMDVTSIIARHEADIAAMLDEDAVRVEVAADKRKNAIRVEREAAPKAESLV